MDVRTVAGTGDRFPRTRHSVVRDVRDADPVRRERALRTIAESYWRPVYTYLRLRWRAGAEDAEDLTQAFFVALLERDLVARFDPERARFRTYLRACLDRIVLSAKEAEGRLKRGGGFTFVPLDFETLEDELRHLDIADPAGTDADPDGLFHREWIRALFARAVERLRRHCVRTGRDAQFAVFERYDLRSPDDDKATYADVARELGLPVTKVTNDLHAMRRRLRRLVLAALRESTATEGEFREEARELFGVDP